MGSFLPNGLAHHSSGNLKDLCERRVACGFVHVVHDPFVHGFGPTSSLCCFLCHCVVFFLFHMIKAFDFITSVCSGDFGGVIQLVIWLIFVCIVFFQLSYLF